MRATPLVLLLLGGLLAGCVDPVPVLIPDDSLGTVPGVTWVEDSSDINKLSFFGPRLQSFSWTTQGGSGHYPASLVVVVIRSLTALDDADLLARAEEELAEQLEEQGIELSTTEPREGTRVLENGISTQWILTQGASEGTGIFQASESVKVVAETGYDESSNAHFVAVGIAQVTGTNALGFPQSDVATWRQIAGDAHGFVDNQVDARGMIYNLVTS